MYFRNRACVRIPLGVTPLRVENSGPGWCTGDPCRKLGGLLCFFFSLPGSGSSTSQPSAAPGASVMFPSRHVSSRVA